jgi:hypothetical protein
LPISGVPEISRTARGTLYVTGVTSIVVRRG